MLELIIWIIIIFAIYANSKKKAEKNRRNQQRPVQQNYRQPSQADMVAKQRELKQRLQQKYAGQMQSGTQQVQQRPVQQPQYRAPQVQQTAQQPQYREPQAQQQSQYRAQQTAQQPQYRAQQAQQTAQQPQYRAPQAQQRPVQQTTRQEDIFSKAVASVREYEEDVPENSALMDELDDLMLMGYQAKMSYERDFLAEGIEMLNSYEMPEI